MVWASLKAWDREWKGASVCGGAHCLSCLQVVVVVVGSCCGSGGSCSALISLLQRTQRISEDSSGILQDYTMILLILSSRRKILSSPQDS